uniref:Uncharacterized protein n=1 Tax=Ditylenchus dipsaci TaxID=166011 RepID=A0A915DHL9_9BILA
MERLQQLENPQRGVYVREGDEKLVYANGYSADEKEKFIIGRLSNGRVTFRCATQGYLSSADPNAISCKGSGAGEVESFRIVIY